MKIGILGAGNVGAALGTRWAQGGHEVIFASRHPESDKMQQTVRTAGPNARAATPAEAAAASEIVVVATPWPNTEAALKEAGDLSGKVLLDVTNPFLPDLSGLDFGGAHSGAEHVSRWAPGAKVVKIFNSVGAKIMADPNMAGGAATMLYAGDDQGAKAAAAQLATELGFAPLDAGPLAQAYLLEHAALLWVSLALKQGQGIDFAFRLHQRK